MSVFKPKDCQTWRYDFTYLGKRYAGSTGQLTKQDAEAFELAERIKVRRRVHGLEPASLEDSPYISDWAEIYYDHAAKRMTRPERVEDLLRVVLRFFGARPSGTDPKNPIVDGEPYRNLRLGDLIVDADHIADFEDWMDVRVCAKTGRRIAPQTKNQYRSVMRQLFQLALQPKWRKRTGVQTNPFDGIYRDRPSGREVTLEYDELRRILQHASYHVRLAVAIGALAPKLRLANILALEWGLHFDAELRYITVHDHKTAAETGRPLVVPIVVQLRTILQDAQRRRPPRSTHVVNYQGRPITQLRGGLKAACTAAGVPYGRFQAAGVTFHSLRHTAATMLADLEIGESKRQSVMGHAHLGTTQKYTHLRPRHEVQPLERLSDTLPIADLVTVPRVRAFRPRPLPPASSDTPPTCTTGGSSANLCESGETGEKTGGNSEPVVMPLSAASERK